MDIKYFNFFTGYTKEKMMRVSNRRMLKMNFSFLMSIFGIYRSACLFNRRHPLHKYLNSFTPHVRLLPYNKAQKLKLEKMYPVFSKILKKIIKKKKNFEHKKKKNEIFHEEILQFHGPNLRNCQLQRHEKHSLFSIKNEIEKNTLVIQKHVRRFLIRKNLTKFCDEIAVQNFIEKLIFIQKNIKKFISKKKIKVFCIIKKIITFREQKLNKITNLIIKYNNNIFIKRKQLIDNILEFRRSKIELIQNTFRKYYLSKLVSTILSYEKNHYVVTYPFYAKEVYMKIYLKHKIRKYNFEYCKLRHCHILYIDYSDLAPGKYQVQFIVDGCVACDGRFPHIEKDDGNFYNIIDFTQNYVNTSNLNTGTEDVEYNYNNISQEDEDDNGYDFYTQLKQNLTGKVSQFSSVD